MPVFLGVLRALKRFEGDSFSSVGLRNALSVVHSQTGSTVTLARDPERNLFRNSGQYWRGTGLLLETRGEIQLTPLGEQVAEGQITQGEFAAIMVQQTVLPNPRTYSDAEITKWRAAGLEIRPLKLILEIIGELGTRHGTAAAFLTNNELIRVVVPLAGVKTAHTDIARQVFLFRNGKLDVSSWPDCAPESNDRRLANEFLLFLSNFGLLRHVSEGPRDDHRYYLEELFDVDAATAQIDASIFGDSESAARAVEEIMHSPLPSIVDRQRTLTTVLTRRGQAQFRIRILNAYSSRCLLTDEVIPEVLEAAHIVPVNCNGSDDEDNGFCLRVDIHRLFDSGNIRIKSNGDILLSEAVRSSSNYSLLPEKVTIPKFVNPVNIDWREHYY